MAEIFAEILRNTQNFGRNSEEKIGLWSLCSSFPFSAVLLAQHLSLPSCCFYILILAPYTESVTDALG